MKKWSKRKWIALVMLIFGLFFAGPQEVRAESASATFGSDRYEYEGDKEFPIGVYLKADSRIGTYHVEISYDTQRMRYKSGAEGEKDGKVILEGTGVRDQIKYMLYFEPISGGEASIEISSVNIKRDNSDVEFDITELDSAPIIIQGEDTVGENKKPDKTQSDWGIETDIPICGKASAKNGVNYYIVDLSKYIPDMVDWRYQLTIGKYGGQKVYFLTNSERTVRFLYLLDEKENFYMYAYSSEMDQLYPCYSTMVEDTKYYYMSPYTCSEWPEELTLDIIHSQTLIYAMNEYGHCGFYRFDKNGDLYPWDEDAAREMNQMQNAKIRMVLQVVMVVLLLIAAAMYAAAVVHQKKKERAESEEDTDADIQYVERASSEKRKKRKHQAKTSKAKEEERLPEAPHVDEQGNEAVISVQNVTMRFRVSTSNASGLKEYLIQLLTGKVQSREFTALDHVSFDVFRGEVVGVIGTNGSGKSTILRIVSGAIEPTKGRVVVDQKKVQLLTLGTGFDMELTARENIYLNGAIIGLTKEFIDEKFDSIVRFAELEEFVDEKVKNFSSGMVSRLGFAIATAGDTAEILILDEVLSVGDEFFRVKSLAKVKEMIHGGSTVLMVSHSLKTIIDHCTKVVWIERGKLRMVGETKQVCAEYHRYNQERQRELAGVAGEEAALAERRRKAAAAKRKRQQEQAKKAAAVEAQKQKQRQQAARTKRAQAATTVNAQNTKLQQEELSQKQQTKMQAAQRLELAEQNKLDAEQKVAQAKQRLEELSAHYERTVEMAKETGSSVNVLSLRNREMAIQEAQRRLTEAEEYLAQNKREYVQARRMDTEARRAEVEARRAYVTARREAAQERTKGK